MVSLAGRTVLVTGGAGGSGLVLVRELHGLGAAVVVGSRKRERFDAVASGLGPERVHPFIADVKDAAEVQRGLTSLRDAGVRPTDLVHCAAGGLESLVRPLMKRVMALRRTPDGEREAAVAAAREELGGWAEASRGEAMRINFEASSDLISEVADKLPEGGTVMLYSSVWSTFWQRSPVPHFYRAIAESKRALEVWLEERSREWATRGITTAVITGHVISDTAMGELIDRFLVPLMPSGQDRFRSRFITSADMAGAAIDVIVQASRRTRPPAMLFKYVIGPHQLIDDLPADSPDLSLIPPL